MARDAPAMKPLQQSDEEDVDEDTESAALLPINGVDGGGVASLGRQRAIISTTKAATSRAIHCVWGNGFASICLAALIFSCGALLVKIASATVPLLEIVAVRSVVSLSICVPAILARGVRPRLGARRNWRWLFMRGTCGCTAMMLYYVGLMNLPLADATTVFFLNPAITSLLAWALRGEALGGRGLAGCGASLAGVVLVAHPPFLFGGHAEWGAARMLGTSCMVGSALFAALSFIAIRMIGRSEPSLVVSLWFHTTSLLASTIPLACGWPQAPCLPSASVACAMLGLSLASFAGQLFLTRGFQLEVASKVAAINYLQVVFGYIFGVSLLGDTWSWLGVAGSVLVAAGVVATTRDKAPGRQEQAVELLHVAASSGPALNKDFSFSNLSAGFEADDAALVGDAAAHAGRMQGTSVAVEGVRGDAENGSGEGLLGSAGAMDTQFARNSGETWTLR